MHIEIKKYNTSYKEVWDSFVTTSKNGTFLFYRDFMEYHSDRFVDFSLLFYLKNKLIAILPANIDGQTIYSHQGLTYGGFLLSTYVKASHVLEIFKSLKIFLQSKNISILIYKVIPHIYHKQPSEEDLYALFRYGAKLIGRSISSCIEPKNRIKYSELRKRKINRSLDHDYFIRENDSFSDFWIILENNLSQKYNTKPVHSLEEMEMLKKIFFDKIHLFEIGNSDGILGGCITFDSPCVSHVQYISASIGGKKKGVLDILLNRLIIGVYNNCKYFDLGTSNENNGMFLNEGLISQKEGFGARGIVYDIYELDIKKI